MNTRRKRYMQSFAKYANGEKKLLITIEHRSGQFLFPSPVCHQITNKYANQIDHSRKSNSKKELINTTPNFRVRITFFYKSSQG